jgi:hypothetical protein
LRPPYLPPSLCSHKRVLPLSVTNRAGGTTG